MSRLDFFNTDDDFSNYLLEITGHHYSFAVGSIRTWGNIKEHDGKFYQLMPDEFDDGFFDWYCEERPNNQFFKNKLECVLRFVKHWINWKKIA